MPRSNDTALIARVRAGDDGAFATLHERYRRPLNAYAGRLLRGTGVDADDVAQEVWLSAHRALRSPAGEDVVAVKPWLYRMTRNRAIDELRRPGSRPTDELDEHFRAPAHEDPAARAGGKERFQELLADLAALPERQRHALLRREVEGISHRSLATEMGLGETATKMLVFRARDNLIRARVARDSDCQEIRVEIAAAHDAGRRPTDRARRHLDRCAACRGYRDDLRALSGRMRSFVPPFGLGFGPLAFVGKLMAGGAGKAAVVATAAAVAVSGAAIVSTQTHEAGDPAPARLVGEKAIVGGQVAKGDPLPKGTTLVMAKVRIEAGRRSSPPARVTLRCPAGFKAKGVQPQEYRPPLGMRTADETPYGRSSVDIEMFHSTTEPARTIAIGLLCGH